MQAINCASALSDVPVQQLLLSGHVEESYGFHLPTNKVILRNMFWLQTIFQIKSRSEERGTDSFFFLVPNEFFNKSTPNAPKHCITGDRDEGEAQHEKGRASATQQGRDKDTANLALRLGDIQVASNFQSI